jgi:hypothetical protein
MLIPTRFLLNPHDPLRDPAWRWKRSGYLIGHGRQPLPSLDDDLTREAWAFRRALARCHTDADRERLAREHPGLAEAHAVHTGEPLRRAELEARLLAGGDDHPIAEKMGLSPAAVAAFHDVHFDVRPHLKAHIYILGVVLGGGRVFSAPEPADQGLLLRLFGYQLGEWAVDALLEHFREPPVVPASLDGLDEAALRRLLRKVRFQLLVLATTTPAEALPPREWLRFYIQFAGARGKAAAEDVAGPAAAVPLREAVEAITTLSAAWSDPRAA